MFVSGKSLRWTAIGGLWIFVAFNGFLLCVQLLLVVLGPSGTWHWPRIYQVNVDRFDPDPQAQYPAVFVTRADGHPMILQMLKQERMALQVDEGLWVLDAYHRNRLRPNQFRLTPQRLLLEFPEPGLLLALALLRMLYRAKDRADRKEREAPRPRTVYRDDFHTRAERFAPPRD